MQMIHGQLLKMHTLPLPCRQLLHTYGNKSAKLLMKKCKSLKSKHVHCMKSILRLGQFTDDIAQNKKNASALGICGNCLPNDHGFIFLILPSSTFSPVFGRILKYCCCRKSLVRISKCPYPRRSPFCC